MVTKKQHIVFSYLFLEFLLLNICIGVVAFVKNPEFSHLVFSRTSFHDFSKLLIIFNLIWAFTVLFNGDQELYLGRNLKKRINYTILNMFLFVGIASTVAVLLKIEYFNRTTFLLPIFLFSLLNLLFFSLLFQIYKQRKKATINSNVLVVGPAYQWNRVVDFTKEMRQLGYGVVGLLDDEIKGRRFNGLRVIGKVRDLPQVLGSKRVDEIFITSSSTMKKEEVEQVIAQADYWGIRVNVIPEKPTYLGSKFKSKTLNGLPVFQHRQTPLDTFKNYILKRLFDILFASCVILLLSPLYLCIAILISLDRKGQILYTPRRKGESGNTFKCYKFRTMSVCDNPINGTMSTEINDPRITRIGKYLRKYDLDELPQFFNVLKGDMSIVGPRPHRTFLQNDFRKIVNDYMVRHYVKPGITGWAQVNGWRGPTTTKRQKKERIKHDLWYIENWSFWLDLKIIFLTVFGKKVRKNAF